MLRVCRLSWRVRNKLDGGKSLCNKGVENRLKAMTATQMEFLGWKEFKVDDGGKEISLVMQVENVGDVPMKLHVKEGKLEAAKVVSLGKWLI